MYNLLRSVKSSLNKFLLRLKDSQIDYISESYNQMFTVNYRSSLLKCNVTSNVFNSVAKTIDCKQLISYLTTILLTEDKIAFNINCSFLIETFKTLQLRNNLVK